MAPRSGIYYGNLVVFDRVRKRPDTGPLAGVDEAGRGALAGPVVAAAVICFPCEELSGVTDSKLLREPVREELYELIRENCLSMCVGIVGPDEIDRLNILQATLKAMKHAVDGLNPVPSLALIDGIKVPSVDVPVEAVRGGDRKSFSIAAASIVAKVTRDRIMRERAIEFPGYGFTNNKGYGTREHIGAIREKGRTSFHRYSFKIHSGVSRGGGRERKRKSGGRR